MKSGDDSEQQVVLFRAAHWMEADSLKSYLNENGIEAFVPNRTSSGSLAGEVDLRLGGASAVSTGFDVFVKKAQLGEAQNLYKTWLNTVQDASEDINFDQDYYLNRFLRTGLFSTFIPVITHFLAVTYMIKYLRLSGSIFRFKFLVSLFLLTFTAGMIVWLMWIKLNN